MQSRWRAPSSKTPDCCSGYNRPCMRHLWLQACVPSAGQREQRVPVCTFVLLRVFLSLLPSNTWTAHDLFFNLRDFSRHYSPNCGPASASKLSYQRSRMQFQREFPGILIGGCSCLNLYLQQSNVSLDWRSLSCGIPCDARPGYNYCRDATPRPLITATIRSLFYGFASLTSALSHPLHFIHQIQFLVVER